VACASDRLTGALRLIVARDAVKDSLLSYAGARDPKTGIVWGGVVADGGTLQFNHGESESGQYVSVGASFLHGIKRRRQLERARHGRCVLARRQDGRGACRSA
jgi:hypothetical protein